MAPTLPRIDGSLLPRKVLFAEPDRRDVKISPDGHRIAWLSPIQNVETLIVAPSDDVLHAEPLAPDPSGDVRSWWWTFDNARIVFVRGGGGSDGGQLYAVDLAKKEAKSLTGSDGSRAHVLALSPRRPHDALIALQPRDKAIPDVYSVDLTTGARTLVAQNAGAYSDWWIDEDLRVRYATVHNADGSADVVQPGHEKDRGPALQHIPFEDTWSVEDLGFDKSGSIVYLKDSRGRDTAALATLDTKSGNTAIVAKDPHGDLGQALLNPSTRAVEAASFDYDQLAWQVIDASVELDFEYFTSFGDGRLLVTSRSVDEASWLIGYAHPDGPTQFYRYDRDPNRPGDSGKSTLLFSGQDDLVAAKLSTMRPVTIKARDGLELVSYLTLPPDEEARDRPNAPLPLVVLVHDGPWARASLEYNAEHQWLASRGYAVLSVNYRGSTGFGSKFVNAGNLEWGAKMHEDILDAVAWAVGEKIADSAKIAIMGVGYGGYETLVGLSTSPTKFACGVDVSGPSNLVTFGQSAAPYSRPPAAELALRMGDFRTDEGKKMLLERSPATHLGAVSKPLLVVQGKDDTRVHEAETNDLVTALRSRNIPVTYVVYPDEGHGLVRAPNRRGYYAVAEAFLAQCLAGRYQPFGDDLAGSSITVPAGAEYIRGLRAALSSKP